MLLFTFNDLVLGEQRDWNISVQNLTNPFHQYIKFAIQILNFAKEFYSFSFMRLTSSNLRCFKRNRRLPQNTTSEKSAALIPIKVHHTHMRAVLKDTQWQSSSYLIKCASFKNSLFSWSVAPLFKVYSTESTRTLMSPWLLEHIGDMDTALNTWYFPAVVTKW